MNQDAVQVLLDAVWNVPKQQIDGIGTPVAFVGA